MSYRTEAVKRYCLLYKQCENEPSILLEGANGKPHEVLRSELFGKVLERVSNLLLYIIRKQSLAKPHLGTVLLEDLYNTAIVGLGIAAQTVTEDESADDVINRIASYVKAEIDKTYPLTATRRDFNFQHLDFTHERYLLKDRDVQSTEDIELAAELGMLRREYTYLLANGFMSEKEFNQFVMHYGLELSCKELGIRLGVINKTMSMIRYHLRINNWEA